MADTALPEIVVTGRPPYLLEEDFDAPQWVAHRTEVRDAFLTAIAVLGVAVTQVHMDAEGNLGDDERDLCRRAAKVHGYVLEGQRLTPGTVVRNVRSPVVVREVLAVDENGYLWRYPDVPDKEFHSVNSNNPWFDSPLDPWVVVRSDAVPLDPDTMAKLREAVASLPLSTRQRAIAEETIASMDADEAAKFIADFERLKAGLPAALAAIARIKSERKENSAKPTTD